MEKLSVIVPVYNEPESISVVIPVLDALIPGQCEIIVVYDFPEDTTIAIAKELQKTYPNVLLVYNDLGRGVTNAIKKGMEASSGEFVFITAADELLSIVAVKDMIRLAKAGCDMVSATRYAHGGKRYGGSSLGHFLSRTGNFVFRVLTGSQLTDATTGMKLIRKSAFTDVALTSKIGWAFAFEISIKSQIKGLQLGEVPIVSVDRGFGGESSFRPYSWLKGYLQLLVWGFENRKRFRVSSAKVMRIKDLPQVEVQKNKQKVA